MVLGDLLPETPIVDLVLIVVATGVIWLGSGWLEESAEELSAYYGLPAVIQGSIVVAVGSSFPEFASVVVAGLAGRSTWASAPSSARRSSTSSSSPRSRGCSPTRI